VSPRETRVPLERQAAFGVEHLAAGERQVAMSAASTPEDVRTSSPSSRSQNVASTLLNVIPTLSPLWRAIGRRHAPLEHTGTDKPN
jgi:hypothetical protein